MKLEKQLPFNEFDCYKIFHKKEGRWQVCVVDPLAKKRTTILYSKYLISIKEKRMLNKGEQVDHIDGNKLNDSVENLQIVTGEENRRRHAVLHSAIKLKHKCPVCDQVFERTQQRSYQKTKNGKSICCSRRCGGRKKSFIFLRGIISSPISANL
jgi:hypothetical protein